MSALENLAGLAGVWEGQNKLQDPENGIAEESATSLAVVPVLNGMFVRLDYTWGYKGKPQEGSMLLGHDPKSGEVTAHWIDSFHTGTKAMGCSGRREGDGWRRNFTAA